MSKEFFEAVNMLEAEKGIPADYLYEKISAAIVAGAKHNYNGKEIVHCDIDPEKQKITPAGGCSGRGENVKKDSSDSPAPGQCVPRGGAIRGRAAPRGYSTIISSVKIQPPGWPLCRAFSRT